MNILPSEWLINYFFTFNFESRDPLNGYLNDFGFNSKNCIINLGSTFIYLIIIIGIHLLLF